MVRCRGGIVQLDVELHAEVLEAGFRSFEYPGFVEEIGPSTER